MIDFGTVRPGTTLYIPFHTFDSNDPSASVTLTGLATSDIEIFKDGSTTQRGSDNGYTLLDTDGIDFDSITGIHGFSINLADNSTAGFYAAGSQYWVVISSVTVDAATINFIAATFRIGYEDAVINTTIATLSSQTSFTLTSGPAEDDALNGCVVCIHDVASAVQLGYAVVSDYTGSTKTVTLAAGTTFTAAATDNISIFPPSNTHTISNNAITASAINADAITAAKLASDVATEIQSGLATQSSVNTIDDFLDTEIAALTTELAKVPKSDSNVTWNATALASIQSEANDALVAYDPPTFAEMEARFDTIDSKLGSPETDIATHVDATFHFAEAIDAAVQGMIIASGIVGSTGNDTTHVHLSGLAYADDGINSMLLVLKDVSTGLFYSRWIEDFANTGDLATVATLPFTPEASTDLYWILPIRSDVTGGSGLDAAGVRAALGMSSANLDAQLDALPTAAENSDAVWDEATAGHTTSGTFGEQLKTDVDAILADTNELQTDWANGGRLDNILDARASQTSVDDIPTNAELATALGTADDAVLARLGTPAGASVSADIADIEGKVDDLESRLGTPSNLGSGATVAANLADIEAQTDDIGTAGAGLSAVPWNPAWDAEVQSECTDALNAYDPPTNAEMEARTIASASYATATGVSNVEADTQDIQSRLPAALTGGGNMKADALAIDGSTTAADRLQRSAEAIAFATVGSGSTTTSIVTSAIDPAASTADQFKGRIVIFDRATATAALRGQATDITASTSGGVLTVTALTTAPASGDTFTIT